MYFIKKYMLVVIDKLLPFTTNMSNIHTVSLFNVYIQYIETQSCESVEFTESFQQCLQYVNVVLASQQQAKRAAPSMLPEPVWLHHQKAIAKLLCLRKTEDKTFHL